MTDKTINDLIKEWNDAAYNATAAARRLDAREALDVAAAQGRNGLVAALAALVEAGLLRDITDEVADDLLEGVLDMLFEVGLIPGGAQ